MGHPVAADDKYGIDERLALWRERGLWRMFLHARALRLHYQGAELALDAPLAPDLAAVLTSLETA